MAIIEVPSKLKFTDVELWNDRVSAAIRSPFTGKRQTRKRPYDLWSFVGNVVQMEGLDAGEMRAFLMELAGQTNSFRLPVPGAKYPLSNYVGVEGLVNGANVTGKSVPTDGWAINTPIVRRGEYFNIGDELKVATASIASNGAGAAVLSFEPPLRAKPADNAQIKVREPFVLLAADDDTVARWKVTAPIRHSFKITATEDF